MRSARSQRRATAPSPAPAPANDAPCGCSAEPGQAVVVCAGHRLLTRCTCEVRDGRAFVCEGHARQIYPDVIVDIEAPAAAEGGAR